MTVGGIRAERMDPADVVWLHMDRPTNLMVVNTVLWFDVPSSPRNGGKNLEPVEQTSPSSSGYPLRLRLSGSHEV